MSQITVEPQTLVPPFAEEFSVPLAMPPEELPACPGGHVELPGSIFMPEHALAGHLRAELDVSRLNRVHSHLWLAGRPGHIRALHRQRMMEREIVVTEQTDLHLVHQHGKIYIKPLPEFLLDHGFFRTHLCGGAVPQDEESALHASACGLLASYVEMVLHESDFRIAVENGLLPNIPWAQWAAFAASVRMNVDLVARDQLNRRYIYGELRCDRLNWIYRLTSGQWMRGYHYIYTEYGHFFGRKLAWLLVAFAYMTVVLTALQLALGTDDGQQAALLGAVGYQFSMATIYGVTGIIAGAFVVFLVLLFVHLRLTLGHLKRKDNERVVAVERRRTVEKAGADVSTCSC